jgi:cytochrome c-type biogenesis protein CcmH/NrfG
MGMIYEKQGKVDMARAAYEKALEIDPENEQAKEALDALDAPEPE